MTGTADPFEHEDAAYVLGALSHEDRLAYEEHLRTCARCSAAVAELAVLPGLLARLPGLPAPAVGKRYARISSSSSCSGSRSVSNSRTSPPRAIRMRRPLLSNTARGRVPTNE